MYCLDRLAEPDAEIIAAQTRADPEFGDSLHPNASMFAMSKT
jgi:hypothetical protein